MDSRSAFSSHWHFVICPARSRGRRGPAQCSEAHSSPTSKGAPRTEGAFQRSLFTTDWQRGFGKVLPVRRGSRKLATTARRSAVEALVARTAAHHDRAAFVTGRSVFLQAEGRRVLHH